MITKTVREKIICLNPPPLEKLNLKSIRWVVATDDEGVKVIALTEDGYRALAENTSKSLEYIKKALVVIGYYKQCIDNHNL